MRPTSTTNELAKARNRAAAERTLTGWIQTCLSLIGFGIAFDRIFVAVNQTFLANSFTVNLWLTTLIGLSAIGTGIFLLVLMIIEYLTEIRSLQQEDYVYRSLPRYRLIIIVGSVILLGLIVFISIILNPI